MRDRRRRRRSPPTVGPGCPGSAEQRRHRRWLARPGLLHGCGAALSEPGVPSDHEASVCAGHRCGGESVLGTWASTRTDDLRVTDHSLRVAAIDCGTNSIRLLVADVARDANGIPQLVDVHREMRVVRLGEGVDATGYLSTHALDRTWRALADYAAVVRASGVVRIRMVATSATRDAANRGDFTEMVNSTLGQDPEVISGDEEAELSFAGAVGELDPATGPFLVVDIGGGSTELVVGSRSRGQNRITGAISIDIGCVRI